MLNKKLLGSVSSLPQDDNFENVTLLLNGDGTNGSQNNTFLDSSTNNFTITRNGNTTQGSFSPYGNLWSVYSDGSGDYLSISDSASFPSGTTEFCYELWFFPTATTNGVLLAKGGDGGYYEQIGIQYNSSDLKCYIANSSNVYIVNAGNFGTPTVGQWNHIAVYRSGNNFYGSLNGTVTSLATSSNSVVDNAAAFVVSGYSSPNPVANPVTGYISNLRLVTGSAVYGASNFTPPTTPLTAITGTQLLMCQANRFIDSSSNAFSITVGGNPSVQRFSPFEPTAPYDTSVIGGSGYFDGSGDYLVTADNAAFALGTGDFTLECWVYAPNVTTEQQFFGNFVSSGAGNTQWSLFLYNGSVGLNGWNNIYATGAITANQWNHVAVSRSGTNLSLFVNGTRLDNQTNSNDFSSTNGVRLGASASGSNPFTGYISNARVVKGTAVYDPASTTITVPTAPLTNITNTSLLANMVNAGIPDLAMQNNLETVGNAQVSTSVKKFGTGSLAFDGTGDYLQIVNNNVFDTNGTFTLECWMYQSSSGDACFIGRGGGNASWSASNGHQFLLFISEGTLYWMWNTGGGNNTSISTSAPASGQWHHLAVGYNGTTTRFWLNGTSLGTSATGYTMPTTRNIIRVGFNPSDQLPLNGYIDDLRFTKGVDRYGVGNSTITVPATNLPTY